MFPEKVPLSVLAIHTQECEHTCLTCDRIHEKVFCMHKNLQKELQTQYF